MSTIKTSKSGSITKPIEGRIMKKGILNTTIAKDFLFAIRKDSAFK